MRRSTVKGFVWFATRCLPFALAAFGTVHGAKRAVEWTDLARHEAQAGRHEAALAATDSALALDPQDDEARVLRARLLSWQGRFDEADSLLTALRREHPGSTDILFAAASLRYYQGRHDEAVREFRDILRIDPDHAEARQGLLQAERALAEAPPAPPRWRVDAGGDYSTFTRRHVSAWNQQFAQLSHRTSASSRADVPLTTYARVERYERYEQVDWSLEAGMRRALSPRLRASLGGGWTPDAVFRPRWRVALDGEWVSHTREEQTGVSLGLFTGVRYDVYKDASFVGVNPGARFMWGGGWAFTGSLSRVMEHGAGATTGWALRTDGVAPSPRFGPVRENIRFWLGLADAPETQVVGGFSETVLTRTVFGGAGFDVGGDWSVMLGYARDDRENSWVRHAVNVGVAHVF
ncbi:MAG TPA: YaiO family outer membrane beta-barrel protein [Fibrobacteria bacterium]|nr:YaiO family outer membrane beta-barrel protein [Fibrobacteria bacterium]